MADRALGAVQLSSGFGEAQMSRCDCKNDLGRMSLVHDSPAIKSFVAGIRSAYFAWLSADGGAMATPNRDLDCGVPNDAPWQLSRSAWVDARLLRAAPRNFSRSDLLAPESLCSPPRSVSNRD